MTRRVLGCAGVLIAVLCATVAQRAETSAHAAAATPVVVPARLADTGLYAGDGLTVDPRNLAFAPQYQLWTDGMTKHRWIYLPEGSAIDGRDEHEWTFPVGTKFWKEFALGGRKVETRLLWKTSPTQWSMVSYAWTTDGTDAVLAPDRGVPAVAEVAPGRRHSIPSRTDCTACHGVSRPGPLGFNALQLSTDRDPNAIHGSALDPGMATLETLVGRGLLTAARSDILSKPPRIRTSDPATRSVLGYLVANCAMCHNGKGEIAAMAPVLRYQDLVVDGDAVAKGFVGAHTKWQQAGIPDGETVLVRAGTPESSAMLARMRSRAPSTQMPPLGTVVRDQAAVDAITRWIAAGPAPAHARPDGGARRRP